MLSVSLSVSMTWICQYESSCHLSITQIECHCEEMCSSVHPSPGAWKITWRGTLPHLTCPDLCVIVCVRQTCLMKENLADPAVLQLVTTCVCVCIVIQTLIAHTEFDVLARSWINTLLFWAKHALSSHSPKRKITWGWRGTENVEMLGLMFTFCDF